MEDLTGKVFKRWTVLKFAGKNKHNADVWECKCKCGTVKNVVGYSLRNGDSRSCGCYKLDNPGHFIHGGRRERLYIIWKTMRRRCNAKTSAKYSNYGGRGFAIIDEWSNYSVFRDWALLNGYGDNLTIERIDVNGNYSPENCKWITKSDQSKNKTNTIMFEINGVIKPFFEWCEIYGVPYQRAHLRFRRGQFPFGPLKRVRSKQ